MRLKMHKAKKLWKEQIIWKVSRCSIEPQVLGLFKTMIMINLWLPQSVYIDQTRHIKKKTWIIWPCLHVCCFKFSMLWILLLTNLWVCSRTWYICRPFHLRKPKDRDDEATMRWLSRQRCDRWTCTRAGSSLGPI